MGVNPGGLGGCDPRSWAGGRGVVAGGRRGGRGRIAENTIAYFAQKVCLKVLFFQER